MGKKHEAWIKENKKMQWRREKGAGWQEWQGRPQAWAGGTGHRRQRVQRCWEVESTGLVTVEGRGQGEGCLQEDYQIPGLKNWAGAVPY